MDEANGNGKVTAARVDSLEREVANLRASTGSQWDKLNAHGEELAVLKTSLAGISVQVAGVRDGQQRIEDKLESCQQRRPCSAGSQDTPGQLTLPRWAAYTIVALAAAVLLAVGGAAVLTKIGLI
jgi:hypothetical protein